MKQHRIPARSSHLDLRIQWDPKSLILIQEGGNYARMIRLRNGQLLCAYDQEGKIWVRHSGDEGRNWQEPIQVAASPGATLTNAELLELTDETVLCLYNERPHRSEGKPLKKTSSEETVKPPRPFTITAARSASLGVGWQTPQTLYTAGSDPANGCWEPSAIQLPSGEVQVYFANEKPYPNSHEQEITLLRSQDGARTWSSPEQVIFRKNSRDGMPSPIVLKNGRGIAVAIEDNGLSGHFKPVIAFTRIKDNWRSSAVNGESISRWSALANSLAPEVYAGASCLRQMPSGETILSFQKDDKGYLPHSRMAVCIGDSHARRFGAPSYPFRQSPGIGQLWNAIFIKNDQTITALSSTIINGVHGVWAIDGRVIR